MPSNISDDLRAGALFYHAEPRPGKIEVVPTKPLGNQRDLALAYSPGVAAACDAIVDDPAQAARMTARGNLVAVISNGTAVLGLGNIGPLAAKPVMEGKAVLFKKFAAIDVFDIEVDCQDVDLFCNVVATLEPTFGGINLEDIKAPECFEIEDRLKKRMKIPVFHDDQHGTAIIVAAAVLNGMDVAGKKLSEAKIVASGAGAAALACLNLLISLGAKRENIYVTDIEGVVYEGREILMDRWKAAFAQATDARVLADVIPDADVFLGLSAGGVLKPEMLQTMAPNPLVLALANPVPEIMPDLARVTRPDVMICTGRSDFPNQVNNVLCFPYMFRGALDVGATAINEAMKHAAVRAIAALAHAAPSDIAAKAYGGDAKLFGRESLIPSPFEPRLILEIAPAVARAAMESGVATRPIEDFDAYRDRLNRFVYRSGLIMKPIFAQAKTAPQRVVYAEGEDERVLRAAQVALEEGIARPILIGRPEVVQARIDRFGLSIRPGNDFEVVNPESDPRYRDYVDTYLESSWRNGVTADRARTIVRTRPTVIAALALQRGDADAMICGLEGRFDRHLDHIRTVLGLASGVRDFSTLSLIILDRGALFIADTYVSFDPSVEELAETAILAAGQVKRFGIVPKIALLSHSAFGSANTPTAIKMREAAARIRAAAPDLEVEGEMHGDAAFDEAYRARSFPLSQLTGEANILIMPNLDAANISYQLLKSLGGALPVGPILIGAAKPAHILTPSVTARGVVNMTALAVVEAQQGTSPVVAEA
ncbi:NADP-dependent malic enzyme [Oceanibacterium hippocampi]|uniref:NAD-dependent malic enzyme n=1 Tax=Oceanibacterium hippocampi TaxID=745714 RepID=A0A1Y5TE23_9PROT|nr:NADP-dependent malic enzyme [Oceanibacterium hippocampi]SLN61747.1 NAD-dependent malic enzyme [Oceanibacterium hippocampi]